MSKYLIVLFLLLFSRAGRTQIGFYVETYAGAASNFTVQPIKPSVSRNEWGHQFGLTLGARFETNKKWLGQLRASVSWEEFGGFELANTFTGTFPDREVVIQTQLGDFSAFHFQVGGDGPIFSSRFRFGAAFGVRRFIGKPDFIAVIYERDLNGEPIIDAFNAYRWEDGELRERGSALGGFDGFPFRRWRVTTVAELGYGIGEGISVYLQMNGTTSLGFSNRERDAYPGFDGDLESLLIGLRARIY